MSKEVSYNGIDITVAENYEEMSKIAAEIILNRVLALPSASILVPTGTTPEGVYTLFSQQTGSFRNVTFFNMDEYCVVKDGKVNMLSEEDPRSYKQYMKAHLFGQVSALASFFPTVENVTQEGYYDNLIEQNGGLDLCLNAMGEDGHTFGFNLPGTPFTSRTRLVQINSETQEVNKKLTGLETPEYAITVGLQTGMEAKEIIFLVSGRRKAGKLQEVIFGPITETIPATILRNHHNCRWIIDSDTANNL